MIVLNRGGISMNSFDRFYGIILFFGALLIAFLPVILITLEEYKFKAMLKKYPLLNHYVITYNEMQDKEIKFYNTFIAPTIG